MNYVVEMVNIGKSFPGIHANDDISLRLKKGEIHALLGENGAGKSTLMNILFGLYQPDEGHIKVRGEKVVISNPNVANDLGIGMVHQHFKLVHNFTVTENIILGMEAQKGLSLDLKKVSKHIAQLSAQYGLNVDPDAKIEDISVGMQQRVEILKMLYRNAEVLIFDEPTAVLTPQEIQDLLGIMKNLIKEGKSIILITHKLREIMAIADRCTVIRTGKYIGTLDIKDADENLMAEMMIGRRISFALDKKEYNPGKTILEVKHLQVNNVRKFLAVKDISFEVRAGEVLGIAGVDGNGQSELIEAITGLRRVESGAIFLNGQDITNMPILNRIKMGIAHIPEDRQKRGLVLDYSIEENCVLQEHRKNTFSKKGFLNHQKIRKHAEKIIKDFDVRSGRGPLTITRTMSGGNQQKTIIGREFNLSPDLLIAAQPTRGLDIGSIVYIHKRIIEQRDAGKAVLLVSLELEEILALSDRIAVVNHGEIVGILDARKTNEKEIGLMMTGIKKDHGVKREVQNETSH